MFFLSAAIYALGAIVYSLLGSGELQSWAGEKQSPETMDLANPKVNEDGQNHTYKDKDQPI